MTTKTSASRFTLSLAALACAGAFVLLAHPAHAATITVTTTADEQTANGQCSLREAVQAANTDAAVDACPAGSGADTIVVPAGTYTLTITDTKVIHELNSLLTLTSDIELRGQSRDNTVIRSTGKCTGSGPCPYSNRIFYIDASANVRLRHITLSDNASDQRNSIGFPPSYGAQGYGGGILNRGSLDMEDSRVQKMWATYGGGIYNFGTLNVRASDVSSNNAILQETFTKYTLSLGFGGGIVNDGGNVYIDSSTVAGNSTLNAGGGISSVGTMTINNSSIRVNSGGGIASHGYLTVKASRISDNRADTAAGISSYGTLELSDSTITNNGAGVGSCGGLSSYGQLSMTHSSISLNTSGAAAGGACLTGDNFIRDSAFLSNTASVAAGLQIVGSGTTTLSHSVVTNNAASSYAGGIQVVHASLNLDNTTISGNTAISESGGLRVEAGSSTRLSYSTIASNTAPTASNLHAVTATITLANSLIAQPIGGTNCVASGDSSGGIVVVGGVIASIGYNLSSDGSCTGFNTMGDIINTNPLIGPLQSNAPGSTLTHALLPGSPAINAGDALPIGDTTTDQRGVPRRWGGGVTDIGAFEVFDPAILKSVYLPFANR